MRIAALAFGVVAGLVASLILALHGLDAAALPGVDQRQTSLIRFGLFIIANFGVLGAGVVLAAPLVGTILFVLGAITWLGAALLLRHGPDYVMLVPPALLLVAAAFGTIAFLRRPPLDYVDYSEDEPAVATQQAAMAATRRDDGDEEDRSGVAVGATFFGDGGTATPMLGAMSQRQADPSMRRGPDDDWQPVRRRTEPPRQRSVFRPPEDEYDDEPGFWRVSRITSSILSFGLYGALVAAAILVFLYLRPLETRHTAARVEASAPVSKGGSAAPRIAAAPTSSRQPSSAEAAAFAPALVAPSMVLPPSSFEQSAPTVAAASEPAPASSALASSAAAEQSSLAPSSSNETPSGDVTLAAPPASGPVMPFAMPRQIAAARSKSGTRQPAPATTPSQTDAGL